MTNSSFCSAVCFCLTCNHTTIFEKPVNKLKHVDKWPPQGVRKRENNCPIDTTCLAESASNIAPCMLISSMHKAHKKPVVFQQETPVSKPSNMASNIMWSKSCVVSCLPCGVAKSIPQRVCTAIHAPPCMKLFNVCQAKIKTKHGVHRHICLLDVFSPRRSAEQFWAFSFWTPL